MTESTVAIVGSGIVGTTFAYLLAKQGYDVAVFEKGPDYPYPHQAQFQEEVLYLHQNPKYKVPADLKQVTQAGDYQLDLNADFYTLVGGSSTRWSAIALRMIPNDFKTKSLYGYGDDWPLTYDDIEPYYCKAEALIGVSGTDEDNPFAPPRSQPYPLPPFELSYDDVMFAEKLRKHDIVLHTTPQARTRQNYGDRVACDNYGPCHVCPTGSRYSPNYHMQLALQTGRCKLYTDAAVRRLVTDRNGQVKSIVYQNADSTQEQEHTAKIVIVAGNAVESARLLLLSRNEQHPDGIGNQAGLVGKNLTFHHGWHGYLRYAEALNPNRFGGWMGQCHQFLDPSTRGKHGATKIEFPFLEEPSIYQNASEETWKNTDDVLNFLERRRHWRSIRFHSEAIPGPEKFVTLSETRDRFGDPFAHVNYALNATDYATHEFAKGIFERFADATEADEHYFSEPKFFTSTAHHHGTCRMGTSPDNSVVNAWGEVHGVPNLFMAGGSQFVTSAAVNPTLTMVALAVRTAEYIADQRL